MNRRQVLKACALTLLQRQLDLMLALGLGEAAQKDLLVVDFDVCVLIRLVKILRRRDLLFVPVKVNMTRLAQDDGSLRSITDKDIAQSPDLVLTR